MFWEFCRNYIIWGSQNILCFNINFGTYWNLNVSFDCVSCVCTSLYVVIKMCVNKIFRHSKFISCQWWNLFCINACSSLTDRLPQRVRLLVSLVFMILLFCITTALTQINTNDWQLGFFIMTMIIIVLINSEWVFGEKILYYEVYVSTYAHGRWWGHIVITGCNMLWFQLCPHLHHPWKLLNHLTYSNQTWCVSCTLVVTFHWLPRSKVKFQDHTT